MRADLRFILPLLGLSLGAAACGSSTPAADAAVDTGTSVDTGAPADTGAPPDAGATADAGIPADTGAATDAPAADAGPPSCAIAGGAACFELPTQPVVIADADGGTTAPNFACDPPASTTNATALPISGTVKDFATSDPVPHATVDVFAGLGYQGTTLATGMSAQDGTYTLTLPAGTHGPLSWRVRASNTLDTYLVNDTSNLVTNPRTGADRASVDTSTPNLLAGLIGQRRVPMTGIVAGEVQDCNGRDIQHAIATLSTTSSRTGGAAPTFVPSAEIYYFTPDPALPTRRSTFSSTSPNGLWIALQVPPAPGTTYYVQYWGFRTAADVARGAAGLSLLGETALNVLPDVVLTVNVDALRAP